MIFWWLVEPEHVLSTEVWNGGPGDVTFNYLQQREPEPVDLEKPPVETDVWGITDGGFRG